VTKLCPVILLPKYSGNSVDIDEVFKRLQSYATQMAVISSGKYSELVVIISSSRLQDLQINESKFPNLRIISLQNNLLGTLGFSILSTFKLKKLKIKPTILISGDPWRGFISCLFVSFISQPRRRIQFQIHGELLPKGSYLLSMILRKLIYSLAINYSTSIRVVSPHLCETLVSRNKNLRSKIVVSPVPVQISHFPVQLKKVKGLNIGFIGRLHPERGTSLCLAITKKMAAQNLNFHLAIIGDGPESSRMRESVAINKYEKFVSFKERVPNSELVEHYRKLNCLLVCAPQEGYGLSIREAVTQGVFVIALENNGTREARELFPESVYLFSTVDEAAALLEKFRDKKLSKETAKNNQERQLRVDQESIANLAKSWIY
jgi:glycosyltransferase involved in cell wall biosynthesis